MTKKKVTTKGGAGRKSRRTVKDRARAIVADAGAYDSDTRKSIKFMLDTNDKDLADFVERAEAGETVCDLTRIDREQADAAGAVAALIDMPGLPVFLYDALMMMLTYAAGLKGVGIWTGGEGDARFSVKGLADLFALAAGLQRELRFEPARDFAGLLSAALTHPDCPSEVYNAVGDCDCLSPARWDTPEFIRLALGMPATADTPKPMRRTNDLAQMIADVWAHPDCPVEIRDGLCQGNSDLFNSLNEGEGDVYSTAEYNRALIVEYLRRRKEGEAEASSE